MQQADAVWIAAFVAGGGRGHRSPFLDSEAVRHVFWLPDQPNRYTSPMEFPSSVAGCCLNNFAVFVAGYSGATATDLNRVPFRRTERWPDFSWQVVVGQGLGFASDFIDALEGS